MSEHTDALVVELVKAAGTHARAEKVLRLLMAEPITNRPVIGAWLEGLAQDVRAADGEPRDPEVGDAVIVHGQIRSLRGGEALVELHGPHTGIVWLPCGQLEHDTAAPLFGAGVAGEVADHG